MLVIMQFELILQWRRPRQMVGMHGGDATGHGQTHVGEQMPAFAIRGPARRSTARFGAAVDLVHRHLPRRFASLRQRQRQRCGRRSEEHTSELQSLMRISYAVFCLKKKTKKQLTRE